MDMEIIWQWIWECWLIVVLSVLLFVAVIAISDPHKVNYYYISSDSLTSCVESSIDWAPDDAVYCSTDIDKVLTTLKSANEALIKK